MSDDKKSTVMKMMAGIKNPKLRPESRAALNALAMQEKVAPDRPMCRGCEELRK